MSRFRRRATTKGLNKISYRRRAVGELLSHMLYSRLTNEREIESLENAEEVGEAVENGNDYDDDE